MTNLKPCPCFMFGDWINEAMFDYANCVRPQEASDADA